MVHPLCVIPREGGTALVGVDDAGALVELASLPWKWRRDGFFSDPIFEIGSESPSACVACAHTHPERRVRRSVLDLRNAHGDMQTRDTNEEMHITALAMHDGRLFIGAYEGLFSVPLDDITAPLVRFESTTNRDWGGVDGLVVDGDRLILLETMRYSSRFALFDVRNPTDRVPIRHVPIGGKHVGHLRLGGAFVLVDSRERLDDAFYDYIHLHDRASLELVSQAWRNFPTGFESNVANTPEWSSAAVLEDVLVVTERSGDVLVVPCDAFTAEDGARGVPISVPAYRREGAFSGVVEHMVPVPYRRMAVVVVAHDEQRSVRVWSP